MNGINWRLLLLLVFLFACSQNVVNNQITGLATQNVNNIILNVSVINETNLTEVDSKSGVDKIVSPKVVVDEVVDKNVMREELNNAVLERFNDKETKFFPGPSAIGTKLLKSGVFDSGKAFGSAELFLKSDGSRLLSLVGFVVEPVADLHIFLVENDAANGVDLGAVVSKKGSFQYVIPSAFDTSRIKQVVLFIPNKNKVWSSAILS